MAQERPTTPEKQLLDLIEDPREQVVGKKKTKQVSFSLFSLSAFRGRVSFLLERVRSGALLKNALMDIRGLNRMLKVFIVLLLIYLGGNFSVSMNKLKETPEFVTRNARAAKDIPVSALAKKNVALYLEGPQARDIFKFGDFSPPEVEEVVVQEEVPPPVVEVSQAEVLLKKLGLVGIGWSDDPDVMIENMETKEIHFLKRGQRIDDVIKVKAIFEDRVILTDDRGKETELR